MRKGRWYGAMSQRVEETYYDNIYLLVSTAKGRAKRWDIPFDLHPSDLIVPDVCPYLKTPFIPKTMYAMSLDRIDPSKGYVKGNVEIISRKANAMKNNATVQELLEFAYEILERY